jgi:hypothetical protein
MIFARPKRNLYRPIALGVLCSIYLVTSHAQGPDENPPMVLKNESTFVWIPTVFKSRNGAAPVKVAPLGLRVLDNGVAQNIEKIETEGLPISLVILMQTGGPAAQFLRTYEALPELIGTFVGNSVHEITFATFDSRVEQIWHFPTRTDGLDYALRNQRPGGKGAEINDAVAFGIHQLQGEPGKFRRVVLLLSQPSDEGSSTAPGTLLQQIGSSRTVIYSLTFPYGKSHAPRSKKRGIVKSAGDPVADAIQSLNDQTSEQLSLLTGGTHFEFIDEPSFNSAMLQAASDFHHTITFGFQPRCCESGFHRITVSAKSSKQRVIAKQFYWNLPPD